MRNRGVLLVLGGIALHGVVIAAASSRALLPFERLSPAPVAWDLVLESVTAMSLLATEPMAEPIEPEPAVEPEPEPSSKPRVDWLGSVSAARCAPFTYGGDDGDLVPNRCPSRAIGTSCLLSIEPQPDQDGHETCAVSLRCGDEVLYASPVARCRLRERATPGAAGSSWDVFTDDRGGSCNGGTSIHVDTAGGRATWVVDNSYGGPQIDEETVVVAITSKGLAR